LRRRRWGVILGGGGEGAVLSERNDIEAIRAAFGCDPEASGQILARGRMRHYPPRACLVRQGDAPSIAFLLILGRAHALLYAADGQVVLLHEYRAGDLFGALGGLGGAAEEADIVAVDAVQAFLLDAAALVALAERNGAIGIALSRLLLKRLRATSERMYERAALSAPGRVCAELLRLARDGEGGAIRPVPVIAELALKVGTTRETASRTVSALLRRGLLRREDDALMVVAPARLEAELV
jgi:CRP/FNR family cyclic AMP-dependent transcriptional regulator